MKKGYIYILVTAFLFSTMEIALKVIADDFNPIQISLTRFLIGGLFLLPFALRTLKKSDLKPSRHDWGRFFLLGFCCVVASMTFYQMAVINTEPAVVAALFSANPLFVAFFAFLILREPLHKRNLIALGIEVVGIVCIINPSHGSVSTLGVIFTMVATLLFAFYGALGTRQARTYGGVVVTCFSFIFGALEMLLLVGLGHLKGVSAALSHIGLGLFADVPLFAGYSTDNIVCALYVFIAITGIGYACWFKAMEETSANETSLVFFLKPPLAAFLAFIFLGENIPFNMVTGIILMLLASAVTVVPEFMRTHVRPEKENVSLLLFDKK